MYKKQLYAPDVFFRKLCRSIATPPSDTDRSLECHEILHHWNDRAQSLTRTAALKPWSYCVRRRHWKLASHIANLLAHRWVQRIFVWNPSVRYRCVGRRPHTWIIKSKFCVDTKVWGRGWKKQHECHHHWTALFEACHTFCQM